MSCHVELTFLPSSWDGKRGHSVHRCREAKQRWTLQTPRHCISCCWPSVLNASTLVLWQEYWVSHREENTVDSLDGKMMVHSPGRTNFNTLHRMLHNTAYKLLNSRIFHWLFPMVDGVTTRHTGLAGWHGHRPYSAASSDMIVISLTNALKLNEFKQFFSHASPFHVLLVTQSWWLLKWEVWTWNMSIFKICSVCLSLTTQAGPAVFPISPNLSKNSIFLKVLFCASEQRCRAI